MVHLVFFRVIYTIVALLTLHIANCILPACITDSYNSVACLLLSLIVTYNSYFCIKRWYFDALVPVHKKAVFITGCDSGFGHETAKRLDSRGFVVFAGCLFPEGDGAQRLKQNCSSRLHTLPLDITKNDSVQSAFDYVKSNLGKADLWAVVNNAGVIHGMDVIFTDISAYEKCLEVNSLGMVRVTKKFLPLIRYNKGRIVNITSIAGRLSFASLSAYTMSKFAAVAFTECLRMEMVPWGVKVISIEPEGFQTALTDSDKVKVLMPEMKKNADSESLADYGDAYFHEMEKYTLMISAKCSEKRFKVVDCIDDAVSLEYPNDVYRPVRNNMFALLSNVTVHIPKPIFDDLFKLFQYFTGAPRPKEAENNF